MNRVVGKIIQYVAYAIAIVIILAATAVSISELLTPYLNEHRADFSKWVSDLLHVPIRINRVTITWRRAEPEIQLQQVSVLNKQTLKPTFEIQAIKINLKIIQSLLQRKLLAEDIRIYGAHLTLHQKKSGQVNVAGLDNFVVMDNLTGGSVAGSAMSTWIFSQPNLALRNIEIEFIPDVGVQRSVSIASLDLHNTTTLHTLRGKASLNQDMPTAVDMNLQWEGEASDILRNTSRVKLYLYLESLSLPQWFSQKTWQQLQIQQGVGSGKFWITWDQGQLQQIQSQFQFYELQLTSLATKKTVVIPRVNGNLSWKRDHDRQLIEGSDLLIDFSEHLWPVTQFSLALSPADTAPKPPLKRKPGGFTLKVGYFDVGDSTELALASGVLPVSLQKLLLALDPQGEVRSFNLEADEPSKPDTYIYSAEFSNLALNPWQSFPGIINADGKISWDGKQGKLTLNSKQTTLIYNSIFEKPLQFDTLTGDILWQKNTANTWSIDTKNINLQNTDMTLNTNLSLSLSDNESPTLNLTGDFSVPHVERIEKYLPLKKLEPPFVSWLHNRFQSGQISSGKITVQGKLSDFPYENAPGKFLVTMKVKDLDFDYAPGWPKVNHVYGDLSFSGHSMTADMESGQLFNVPLTKVHGYIPYIGPNQPQILDLQAVIDTDLNQGLQFIQESPLRNTLGRDLANLQLSGAMNLKLALTIPVKTPANTQVVGDIIVTSALLQLPSWHIALDHLAGDLHFTEQSIQSPNMQGRLFDEPVNLTMNTIHPSSNAPPVVKALLQSQISQATLEKLLKMPLSQFIKGQTPYSVELNIISHRYTQPSQLIIHSDLKGLQINLPEIYGKKAEESRDFQLTSDIKQNQPLQVKIQYGTPPLLTAALTYEKATQGWQFYGGELRLGNQGQTTWQTSPGILVTGHLDQLDWNKWYSYFSSLSWGDKNKKVEPNAMLHYLRGIDIDANQFPVWGQSLTKARVQLMQENNTWKVSVTSPEATGQVWLPNPHSQSILRAEFQHLYLTQSDSQQSLDPKTWPAFSFTGDDVRYKDQPIGHILLESAPTHSGLKIQKLNIFTDFFNLNAKGEWTLQKNSNKTNLVGSLTTKNISQLLDHWGWGSANLVAGKGDATFDLRWADKPLKPSLATLSGSFFLKLDKGRVINLGNSTDAKLGFGRMLNILNLQTLPRRLSLDFTDVFEKGYSFDIMEGHFNLDNGNATTHDTYFAGPIARIEIQGTIGLAAKDYDLALSVTPYVTGSIPVVATLAAGPVVGAVTWLVEKAASGVVSKAATYHYSVKGPWDHPVWEKTN